MEIKAEVTGHLYVQDDNIILESIKDVILPSYSSTGVDVNLVRIAFPSKYFGLINGINDFIVGGGVIDEEYRGVIKVIVINNQKSDMIIKAGTKLASMQIMKYLSASFVGLGKLPSKKNPNDAGYDIEADYNFELIPGKVFEYKPQWTTDGIVRGRSGLALKTVQAKFVGNTIHLTTEIPIRFSKSDRIAQVIKPGEQLKKFKISIGPISTDTVRGEAGFGSSGL